MCINIISEFAKLAGLESYISFAKQADEQVKRIAAKLVALLDEDKAILYKNKLEKHLNIIENEIDSIVNMYNATEKKLFDIDKEIQSNRISEDKLLEFINSHIDEEL